MNPRPSICWSVCTIAILFTGCAIKHAETKEPGLTISIALDRESFAIGEDIPVEFRIMNASNMPLGFWSGQFWLTHHVILEATDKSEVPLTEVGRSRANAFNPDRIARSPLYKVTLQPGQTLSGNDMINLPKHFVLKAGKRYRLQVVHEDYLADGWFGRHPSNTVEFRIQ